MNDLLVRNAGRVLVDGQAEGGALILDGPAAVLIRNGQVDSVVAEQALGPLPGDVTELDAAGGAVIPGFVDAHTHLVFAGDRSEEFAARQEGRPYEAGGIMSTVGATREASRDELLASLIARAEECLRSGTTTIEVKSGYGLETETERRCLEVVAEANERVDAELVPTFLGAHLDPEPGYIDHLVAEMLPACAPLAQSCDAFCDVGALDVEQSRRVLTAARQHGLQLRLHAEELAHTGGALLAAELGCASADHLVHATAADGAAMAAAGVVAVLLPATSFCLRSAYADARMLMDQGCTLALATDCNPGTSYVTSMPFVIAVACSQYGLTATEAVGAATHGGAKALARADLGTLEAGRAGDLVVLAADHWVDFAYRPGADVIASVIKGGKVVA